jgi:hypothetical protein
MNLTVPPIYLNLSMYLMQLHSVGGYKEQQGRLC